MNYGVKLFFGNVHETNTIAFYFLQKKKKTFCRLDKNCHVSSAELHNSRKRSCRQKEEVLGHFVHSLMLATHFRTFCLFSLPSSRERTHSSSGRLHTFITVGASGLAEPKFVK